MPDARPTVRSLSFGSLFKIMFVGGFLVWLAFGAAMGALAWAGFETVKWNQSPITGWPGFAAGIAMTTIFGGLIAALGSFAGAIMIKLFGVALDFGPIRLRLKQPAERTAPAES